jgi:hypothetical protein
MSQPEIAGEQEVDFGRYWLAIVRRWWLPIGGLVIGAILGVIAQTGGARPYEASTTVYLGQPFVAGTAVSVQSLPTKLGFVQEVVSAKPVVKSVAAKVGLGTGVLRNGISTKAVDVSSGAKQVGSPLIRVIVRNPSARKAVDAADLLAANVVKEFSTYVDVKLGTYQARLDRTVRELAKVNQRIEQATAQQAAVLADKSVPETERLLVLVNYNNVLQFNETRRANLEGAQLSLRDSVALAQQIERARIVQPAVATRISAASKRSGLAVGLVVGFVLGLLGAILWEPSFQLVKRARAAE